MSGTWQQKNGRYGSSQQYLLGQIAVAEVFYSGTRPKGDPKVYEVAYYLPRLKSPGRYEDEATAKQVVEGAVFAWLKAAGLVSEGDA